MLLGADLQGFTFYLILACNVNFIAEVLFSKACGIFSLTLWAWDTKYWWFEGFFMKKKGNLFLDFGLYYTSKDLQNTGNNFIGMKNLFFKGFILISIKSKS